MKYTTHYSRKDIEALEPPEDSAIISITCLNESPANLKDGWVDILRLVFDDTTDDERQLADERLATQEDFDTIERFCETHKDRTIIVHCEAGMSRSSAVALYVSGAHGHEFRPGANGIHPNPYVSRMLNRKLWLEHGLKI